MASIGDTTRPAFAYDQATDTWVPVGVGPHSHTPAAIGAISNSLTTTTGDLIYAASANTPARLGIGSTGNVLTVSGGVPVWSAPAGGGKVLQVVYASTGTTVTSTSTSFADTGLSASITPSSTSSKILILVNQAAGYFRATTAAGTSLKLVRNTTDIFTPGGASAQFINIGGASSVEIKTIIPVQYLDSPSTTSSTTYKVQGRCFSTSSSGETVFQASNDQSTIVLIEIGA